MINNKLVTWVKSWKMFRTEFTIYFDENGNIIKEKSDKIPCGIPDWFAGILALLGVLIGVLGLLKMAFP